MVGNGIPKLVERFAPAGTDQPTLDQAFEEFMAWYDLHKEDKTAPYPGMKEAALRLKEAGVSIAVLSNKADEMAGPVVEGYYPKSFPLVQGALPGVPTKPDPTLLHRLMERMGASQENTLFVGDSDVDIRTAKNGGLTSCGVLWGFRSRQELEREGADYLVSTPEELLALILGEQGGRRMWRRPRPSSAPAVWWASPRRRCTGWGPTAWIRRRWPISLRPRAVPRTIP